MQSAVQIDVGDRLKKVQDEFKDILKKHHRIPADSTDQCASARLDLDDVFAKKQPYNLKSAACQIQASTPDAHMAHILCSFRIFCAACVLVTSGTAGCQSRANTLDTCWIEHT